MSRKATMIRMATMIRIANIGRRKPIVRALRFKRFCRQPMAASIAVTTTRLGKYHPKTYMSWNRSSPNGKLCRPVLHPVLLIWHIIWTRPLKGGILRQDQNIYCGVTNHLYPESRKFAITWASRSSWRDSKDKLPRRESKTIQRKTSRTHSIIRNIGWDHLVTQLANGYVTPIPRLALNT
jgi:hypothetical protein